MIVCELVEEESIVSQPEAYTVHMIKRREMRDRRSMAGSGGISCINDMILSTRTSINSMGTLWFAKQ
jgi:hypothetical protein